MPALPPPAVAAVPGAVQMFGPKTPAIATGP